MEDKKKDSKEKEVRKEDGFEVMLPLRYEKDKIITGGIEFVRINGKKRKVKSMVGCVINLEKEV